MIDGRDETCPTCQRRRGDHTLDELNACLGTVALDLEHEDIPDGPLKWSLDGRDVVIADHVVARSLVSYGVGDVGKVSIPVLHLTFAVGVPGAPPNEVAEIGLIGSPEGIRRIGKLLRDTANSAANAAELTR